jgi:regulation of enolase protein 1 (concanavalin A-like superfamily)
MEYKLLNNAHSLTNKDDIIEIISPPNSNFFNDITTNIKIADAPFYYTTIENDFIFRSIVNPELNTTYDAGGILIFESINKWIKFAYEKTDLGYNSLVSVITNKTSDDCNGEIINNKELWMQIVRKNNNWCLHFKYNY